MTNINLATSSLPQKQGLPYKTGIISIVTALVVLIGGYFWLTMEKNKIASEIGTVNSGYMAEYQKLTTSNKEIVDFQNRITLAKGLLDKKNVAVTSFPELEKDILPGVYLTSYALDGSNLTLAIVANDFDVLARQIASFKKSGYFSAVSVGKATLDSNNKVVSEIILSIN